jgi:hypothetical protein
LGIKKKKLWRYINLSLTFAIIRACLQAPYSWLTLKEMIMTKLDGDFIFEVVFKMPPMVKD